MAEKLLEILKKNVDEKGLARDVFAMIIQPQLEAYAAGTENKIDDMAIELLVGAVAKALA